VAVALTAGVVSANAAVGSLTVRNVAASKPLIPCTGIVSASAVEGFLGGVGVKPAVASQEGKNYKIKENPGIGSFCAFDFLHIPPELLASGDSGVALIILYSDSTNQAQVLTTPGKHLDLGLGSKAILATANNPPLSTNYSVGVVCRNGDIFHVQVAVYTLTHYTPTEAHYPVTLADVVRLAKHLVIEVSKLS